VEREDLMNWKNKIMQYTATDEALLKKSQRKYSQYYDNMALLKFSIFLVPMLIYCLCAYANEIHCPHCENPIEILIMRGPPSSPDGVWWRCHVCHSQNWSESCDWQGYYYCGKCGERAINPQKVPSNGFPGTPKR
jgi:hypothetical protein